MDDDGLQSITDALGVGLPDPEEQAAVLDLTRVIAHSSERRFGPLTIYALALSLDPSTTAADRVALLRQAIDDVEDRPPG